MQFQPNSAPKTHTYIYINIITCKRTHMQIMHLRVSGLRSISDHKTETSTEEGLNSILNGIADQQYLIQFEKKTSFQRDKPVLNFSGSVSKYNLNLESGLCFSFMLHNNNIVSADIPSTSPKMECCHINKTIVSYSSYQECQWYQYKSIHCYQLFMPIKHGKNGVLINIRCNF